MAKHREKLLDKLVKRDLSNDLEEVLTQKSFQEEAKNLLLDILYKIGNSYKDYETVKKNVVSQEEYVQKIIECVKNKCNIITLKKMNNSANKNFEVDRENKEIKCYPISRNLLYCLSKIQKCDNIIKDEPQFLNKALTNMINTGNNINTVEPLRDFNGFSWDISVLDIENFYYNLVYQDLVILCGNKILEEWTNVHDKMIDYKDLIKEKLEKKYGKRFLTEISELLKIISILLELSTNKEFKQEMLDRKAFVEQELIKMEDKAKYVEELSNKKKNLTKEIRKIDLIISSKDKLDREYVKRNKNLPLEQKIFSKRILKIMLSEEREKMISELKEISKKMTAKKFLQNKKAYNYELKYLDFANVENLKKETLNKIVLLQKRVLQAFEFRISRVKSKENLIKILYELRYFNQIPIDTTKNIGQIPRLKKKFQEVEKSAIQKAYELKIINEIFNKNPELNFKVLEHIFSLHIIRLEDINSKIVLQKDGIYVQFYDENIADEKINLDFDWKKEGLKIKLNKKVKLFV